MLVLCISFALFVSDPFLICLLFWYFVGYLSLSIWVAAVQINFQGAVIFYLFVYLFLIKCAHVEYVLFTDVDNGGLILIFLSLLSL